MTDTALELKAVKREDKFPTLELLKLVSIKTPRTSKFWWQKPFMWYFSDNFFPFLSISCYKGKKLIWSTQRALTDLILEEDWIISQKVPKSNGPDLCKILGYQWLPQLNLVDKATPYSLLPPHLISIFHSQIGLMGHLPFKNGMKRRTLLSLPPAQSLHRV